MRSYAACHLPEPTIDLQTEHAQPTTWLTWPACARHASPILPPAEKDCLDFGFLRFGMEYEPCNTLEWDESSERGFLPDFYLPGQDLYIELTTPPAVVHI
jgi:hypothetical protein